MNIEIADSTTETKLNWYDGVLYCNMLNHNGFGWRLPTKFELYSFNNQLDIGNIYYWTSTECDNDYAWIHSFNKNYNPHKTFKYNIRYIRAVRNI